MILSSIQIIGIFIAIIYFLSNEFKKSKSTDTIEDINNKLENMNEQFDKYF